MAKRSGLGRGLGSLIGEATAEARLAETSLPLGRVKPNKDQPRKSFDPDTLAELTESIRRDGVLQPILVRKKGQDYEIVAGERRYQAACAAGLEEIPVVIRDMSDEEALRLALIENLQRSDLNPIEEAQGYKALIEAEGLTQEELGKVLSKSRSAIANTLRLLDLPQEVQSLMVTGGLTAGHARAILAVPGEEARVQVAQRVVEDGLSVRQTEAFVASYGQGEAPSPVPVRGTRGGAPESYRHAARQLRAALGTEVRVKRVRNRNKIEITFETEEDLARLVELLSHAPEEGGNR